MGSGISKLYQFPTHEFHSNIKQYSHYYNSLHLSEDDIWKLYQVFQEIDQSQLGYIKILDLIKYLKLLQTKFIYKIFTIFDTFQPPTTINNQQHNPSSPSIYSGCIHFHQFVISCWSVCTLYQKDYTLYLFNLYDLDESGFLDIKITQQIIEDIYGDEFKRDMEAQRSYDHLGTIASKSIDPYTFQRCGGGNPRVLFQIFSIQSTIRKGIVGEDFWDEHATRRAQLNPGIHVSVHSLLGHSRRGKLRSSSRGYGAPTSSTAGAPHSSEDFKLSRRDSDIFSISRQVSQKSLISQCTENQRKDSHVQALSLLSHHSPDIFEMETLP